MIVAAANERDVAAAVVAAAALLCWEERYGLGVPSTAYFTECCGILRTWPG